MRSVGFMGYSRSGKDTATRVLVDTHGYRRVSFADPVREMALALDPIIGHVDMGQVPGHPRVIEPFRLSEVVASDGWERAKDEHPEVRRLLQRLGTDAVRDIVGPDTWVRIALDKIRAAESDGVPVAVSDVRFPNEARMLRDAGFLLVWVERPGHDAVNGHVSESGLSPADADAVVRNDAGLVTLYRRVRQLAEQ